MCTRVKICYVLSMIALFCRSHVNIAKLLRPRKSLPHLYPYVSPTFPPLLECLETHTARHDATCVGRCELAVTMRLHAAMLRCDVNAAALCLNSKKTVSSRGYRETSPSSSLLSTGQPAVCCSVVLPVCSCVVSFTKFHAPDTHDLLRTSR